MIMILTERRSFLLLEVLIAFIFVVGAFFPLIYPHFYILQQQHSFIEKLEIDNAVNDFYGYIIEQLQQNQISWQAIEEGTVFPIDENFWKRSGDDKKSPFVGAYRFRILNKKSNDKYELCLVELHLVVTPGGNNKKKIRKNQNLTYTYQIFMSRLYSKA